MKSIINVVKPKQFATNGINYSSVFALMLTNQNFTIQKKEVGGEKGLVLIDFRLNIWIRLNGFNSRVSKERKAVEVATTKSKVGGWKCD